MWNLPRPDITGVRGHLDIVFPDDATPAVVTETDKDALEALYDAYLTALGRPSDALLGLALSAQLKKAVYDAYGEVQEKGKLSALRSALKLVTAECPYCGFGQIQDLDHHLPKGVYKPFSIFSMNLIPCCATCNRGKARKPSENPAKHWIHSYLDDVSQFHFLYADVHLDATNQSFQVRFHVVRPEKMPAELHARLVHHLEEFKLHERYSAQANIYLCALETSFEQAYESGGADGLKAFLLRSAEKSAERSGINDWRTALLHGLADSDEFCDGGFVVALGRQATATCP